MVLHQQAVYLMGTVFTLQIFAQDAQRAQSTLQKSFELLQAYDQTLSDYRGDSELNQVLALALPGKAHPVSPRLREALRESAYYGQLSQGAFDISIHPLVTLWGFKDQQYHLPTAPEIQATLAKIGLSQWQLRPQGLVLAQANLRLDFGAIGKGLAIDAAIDLFRAEGMQAGSIDSGGSTRFFLGHPPAMSGWPVMIKHPYRAQVLATRYLQNQAISTSGDDQQFFELNGRRYSHILDPRTGYPIQETFNATVIASTATEADALSTAVLLLNPQEIQNLFERHPQLEIWRLGQDNQGEWLEYFRLGVYQRKRLQP